MIVDTSSFFIVLVAAATAPLIAACAGRLIPAVVVPIAVVELVLGAIVGPHGIGAAHVDGALQIMGTLGLGFLFFLPDTSLTSLGYAVCRCAWARSAGQSRWRSRTRSPDCWRRPAW